jgi:hypothetical protein
MVTKGKKSTAVTTVTTKVVPNKKAGSVAKQAKTEGESTATEMKEHKAAARHHSKHHKTTKHHKKMAKKSTNKAATATTPTKS